MPTVVVSLYQVKQSEIINHACSACFEYTLRDMGSGCSLIRGSMATTGQTKMSVAHMQRVCIQLHADCRRSLEMKREMPTYIGVGIVWLLCFLFLCLFHIFCDKSTLLSAACTLLWWALCTLWCAANTLLSAAYTLLYVVCRGLCALWRMHFAACTLLWWALCCAQCSLWRMCATARAAQSGDTRRVANCSQSPPSYCSRLLQAATADSYCRLLLQVHAGRKMWHRVKCQLHWCVMSHFSTTESYKSIENWIVGAQGQGDSEWTRWNQSK